MKQLMEDALILAKQRDFDVLNALDLMDNGPFKDWKFGIDGTGGTTCTTGFRDARPGDIGLVLT